MNHTKQACSCCELLSLSADIQMTEYTENEFIRLNQIDLNVKHIIDEQFFNKYLQKFELFRDWSDNPEGQYWETIHRIVGYINFNSENCYLIISEEFSMDMPEDRIILVNIGVDGNSISATHISDSYTYPGAHKYSYSKIGNNKIETYEISEGILDQDKDDPSKYLHHYDSISSNYELINSDLKLIKSDTTNHEYWK